jgi:hypothetical protein
VESLFRHNFLIAMALGLAAAGYLYAKFRPMVQRDPALQCDAQAIVRGTLVIVCVPTGLAALLQYIGGFSDGFFLFSSDFGNPVVLAGWFLQLALSAVIVVWAWRTNGPKTLLRFRAVFTHLPKTPQGVRWYATLAASGPAALRVFHMVKYVVDMSESQRSVIR